MKKHHKTHYNDPWDRDYYGTGSTRPPKNHGGIIAFLLVMVILLGGACSALGILNVRLLQELADAEPEPATVYLFQNDPTPKSDAEPLEADGRVPQLGLWSQTVSDFDRRFYDLPYGALVTDLAQNGAAEAAGLRTGDVITALQGQSIRDQESLQRALAEMEPGQQVQLRFYRQQTKTNHRITLTIEKESD